jgi:hypothetical protein
MSRLLAQEERPAPGADAKRRVRTVGVFAVDDSVVIDLEVEGAPSAAWPHTHRSRTGVLPSTRTGNTGHYQQADLTQKGGTIQSTWFAKHHPPPRADYERVVGCRAGRSGK